MEAKPTRGDAEGMIMEAKPTQYAMIMEAKPTIPAVFMEAKPTQYAIIMEAKPTQYAVIMEAHDQVVSELEAHRTGDCTGGHRTDGPSAAERTDTRR